MVIDSLNDPIVHWARGPTISDGRSSQLGDLVLVAVVPLTLYRNLTEVRARSLGLTSMMNDSVQLIDGHSCRSLPCHSYINVRCLCEQKVVGKRGLTCCRLLVGDANTTKVIEKWDADWLTVLDKGSALSLSEAVELDNHHLCQPLYHQLTTSYTPLGTFDTPRTFTTAIHSGVSGDVNGNGSGPKVGSDTLLESYRLPFRCNSGHAFIILIHWHIYHLSVILDIISDAALSRWDTHIRNGYVSRNLYPQLVLISRTWCCVSTAATVSWLLQLEAKGTRDNDVGALDHILAQVLVGSH